MLLNFCFQTQLHFSLIFHADNDDSQHTDT